MYSNYVSFEIHYIDKKKKNLPEAFFDLFFVFNMFSGRYCVNKQKKTHIYHSKTNIFLALAVPL